MRFKIDDTSFAFVNCFLSKGDNVRKRVDLINRILEEAFELSKGLYSTKEHDVVFLLGNLNFKIGVDRKSAIEALGVNNLEHLVNYDDLNVFWQTDTEE